MGELIISPANFPFMIGAVSSFALIASIPVTEKDIRESSQRATQQTLPLQYRNTLATHSQRVPLAVTAVAGDATAVTCSTMTRLSA